jgi:hypothetical protein
VTETTPIYLGEARLIRWAHSDSAGRTITLQLPEDAPRHPFEGIPTGKEYGQRMQIVCVAIDDHEQPLDAKDAKRPKKKGHGPAYTGRPGDSTEQPHFTASGQAQDRSNTFPEKPAEPAPVEKALCGEVGRKLTRSQKAALKCQDADFQEWFAATLPTSYVGDGFNGDAVACDYALKEKLGITSKRELDTDGHKAAAWDALITDFELRDFAR